MGAVSCLRKEKGRGFIKQYLRNFLDFRLGWKAYCIPIFVLGGTSFIAWFIPELFGAERLPMLLPSIWYYQRFESLPISAEWEFTNFMMKTEFLFAGNFMIPGIEII